MRNGGLAFGGKTLYKVCFVACSAKCERATSQQWIRVNCIKYLITNKKGKYTGENASRCCRCQLSGTTRQRCAPFRVRHRRVMISSQQIIQLGI